MNIFKATLFLPLLLTSSLIYAVTKDDLLAQAESMSPDQVWNALKSFDQSGNTKFGKCHVIEGSAQTACDYYFRGAVPGDQGSYGWPKNALYSGGKGSESTGCLHSPDLAPRNISASWQNIGNEIMFSPSVPLSSGHVYTPSAKVNAKNILLSALRNTNRWGDVCGIESYVQTLPTNYSDKISFTQVADIYFVRPGSSCSSKDIICGVLKKIDPDLKISTYTELPSGFCYAAYSLASKPSSDAELLSNRTITCEQRTKFINGNDVLLQATQLVGTTVAKNLLASDSNPFEKSPYKDFLQMSEAQLLALDNSQLSDFYVAAKKRLDTLPPALTNRLMALSTEVQAAAQSKITQSLSVPKITSIDSFETTVTSLCGDKGCGDR